MKRKFIIIALPIFLGFSNNLFSQNPSLAWAKGMGGASDDYGNSIAVDYQGNVYTTGTFYGPADFDPGTGIYNLTTIPGYNSMFVSKLDAFGNFLWAKGWNNFAGWAYNYYIAVDAIGNVYITGTFDGTFDADPGPGTYNLTSVSQFGSNVFVIKIDSSGNFIWAKNWGNNYNATCQSISVDVNGNVYTTGVFGADGFFPLDFDPGPETYNLFSYGSHSADVFVSKLNSNGNFLWAKQLGGTNDDFGTSIAVDKEGNVYTTGFFNGTADFDPNSGTYNLTSNTNNAEIFVSKLDASGNFIWAKQLGGTNIPNLHPSSITLDSNENVYTIGCFIGTGDFDPGPGTYNLNSAGGYDIFISKLDVSGNFLWAKSMGGPSDDFGASIGVDANGNVYTTGRFSGTVDFDPGNGVSNLTSVGLDDIFISKLDTSGNFLWVKQMGSTTEDYGYSIACNANGNVYTIGAFSGTADFDPDTNIFDLTSAGGYDIFVLKLWQDIPITTIYPKLYLNTSSINAGQILSIVGADFAKNGEVKLSVSGPAGFSQTNILTAASDGRFTFSFGTNTSLPAGIYNILAIDIISGNSSPVKLVQIINGTTAVSNLKITSPIINIESTVNKSLRIDWSDIPSHLSALIPNKSLVDAQYKIGYNKDNTGWNLIDIKSYSALYQQQSNFEFDYTPIQTGSYQFKVTDMLDDGNSDISAIVTVTDDVSGVAINYDWDYSGNRPPNKPIGLAADGTSRIYVKISKKASNNKTISKVSITSKDPNNPSISETRLLGKLMQATPTSEYNLEANTANLTTVNSSTPDPDNIFWFWYVAPDDFVRNDDDTLESSRTINLLATITYSDNSIEDVTEKVEIVRPPLMLVHGLGSDESSWKDFYYTINGDQIPIFFSGMNFSPWKISRALNMYPGGSYISNAQLLLSLDTTGNYKVTTDNSLNSFQFFLKGMRGKGFSCNRVDYVAHSMGGDMARTAINKYPSEYYPGLNSPQRFKNYGKGFINKLITLNTPHNGSPWADWLISTAPNSLALMTLLQNFHYYGIMSKLVNSSFNSTGFLGALNFYDPTEALKNLRYGSDGVKFLQSTVKNHLISGDIMFGGEDCLDAYNEINNNKDIWPIVKMFLAIGADECIRIDQILAPYGVNDFFENSDLIVPLSSQLPNKNLNSSGSDYSIFYGSKPNHLSINNSNQNPEVGQKVFDLLNSPINSLNFADNIAANTSSGSLIYSPTSINNFSEWVDTTKIVITNPIRGASYSVDSTINISVKLKDTLNFKKLNILFQSEVYSSSSKASIQSFNAQVNPVFVDSQIIVATAVYDSLGNDVFYTDTLSLNILKDSVINGFYITPKIKYLDSGQTYIPTYNLIHNTYISNVSILDTALHMSVADTNVVTYSNIQKNFIAKDTGTTYAVISYKQFKDTLFIIIDTTTTSPGSPLPINLISFTGQAKPSYNLLEWRTASESNFSHFVLQRSLDGLSWLNISSINSRLNSNAGTVNYDYKDSLTSNNVSFYRLLLLDIDGNFKTSNVVRIQRSSNNSSIRVFPNPVIKSEVFVDLGNYSSSSNVIFTVIDLSGKIVKTISEGIQNSNLFRLDLNGLRPSIYLLKIQTGDKIQTIKLLLLE